MLTTLDPSQCRVGGINQNHTSSAGTPCHIQVEDRGPVFDRLSDQLVRRLSVIVYANYGSPGARIIHGRDHDFPDLRTREHNALIERKVLELAAQARDVIEEKEDRQAARIRGLVRHYYSTRDDASKQELERAREAFPFVFQRAWSELKAEKASADPPAAAEPAERDEVVYPLDAGLREQVLELERIVIALGQGIHQLKAKGRADDILLQRCRKLVTRARKVLASEDHSDFSARRLEMTRDSLLITWRLVQSLLK